MRGKFAHIVSEMRKEHHLSLAELSKLTGIQTRTLSEIERGHNITTLDSLQQLSLALRIRRDELLRASAIDRVVRNCPMFRGMDFDIVQRFVLAVRSAGSPTIVECAINAAIDMMDERFRHSNWTSLAPWSSGQVDLLNIRQQTEGIYTYTCPDCRSILTAYPDGWHCDCGYRQVWC